MSKQLQEATWIFLITEKKEEQYFTNHITPELFSDQVIRNIDNIDEPLVKCGFPVEKNTFDYYK